MAIRYVESSLIDVVSAIERVDTFAIDIETTGLSPFDSRMLLCQIGVPDEQFVINLNVCPIEPLLPYLKSNRWKKIIQNEKFEQRFFQYMHKTTINNVWDTYLAELTLYPDARQSSSLESLASKYLDIDLDKNVRKSFLNQKSVEFSSKQVEYAARDVEVLFPIMEIQKERGKELGLEKILDIEFDLGPVVADMENTGTPIDSDLWKSKLGHFEELHEESRLRIHDILFDGSKLDEQLGMFVRDSIDLNSNKQVKEVFHKLGYNVTSTSEREISLIRHPFARELLNYRGYQKIVSSYGKSFIEKIHPFTKRIHPDFQQLGAGTGRFSCREPNMQQIPEEFHSCVKENNYLLVTADYSQIELRILAQSSNDPNLLKAFNSGYDLHKATAALMFNIPLDSVSKEQRFMAKTMNFGIVYGMKIKKLRDMLNADAIKNNKALLTYPQVQDLMSRYYKTYKTATGWLSETGSLAYKRGFSETLLGRKRFYNKPDPNLMSQDEYETRVAAIKRQGANGPIQGTNADITKKAMIAVFDELLDSGYKANIILQVHDELVLLAQRNHAEGVKLLLEETMRNAAEEVITEVPIVCEAKVAESWSK